jgi:hypothetical protein
MSGYKHTPDALSWYSRNYHNRDERIEMAPYNMHLYNNPVQKTNDFQIEHAKHVHKCPKCGGMNFIIASSELCIICHKKQTHLEAKHVRTPNDLLRRLEEFLNANPHLRKKQEEIDRVFDAALRHRTAVRHRYDA